MSTVPSSVCVSTRVRGVFVSRSRQEFRDRAAAASLATRPETARLIVAANEVVAHLCLFASRKDFKGIRSGLYIADLIVSFLRTHFIAVELITQGELIEAGVLVRKQMELVARLHELRRNGDIEGLLGRTPNVRYLQEFVRSHYARYSEIAHSSHPRSLALLGKVEEGDRVYTPVYPVFDENAYVALVHVGFLVVEFSLWTKDFYDDVFAADRPSDDLLREFWLCFVDFVGGMERVSSAVEEAVAITKTPTVENWI